VFSGIVEATVSFRGRDEGRYWFDRGAWTVPLAQGSSVAFDGVCLTVVVATEAIVGVDVVPETLQRTTLGRLTPGDLVNVERSVTLETLLDGGLVLGHVDAVGEVVQADAEGLWVAHPERFASLLVEKGTVIVNGVALTVAELGQDRFRVATIPETRRRTNLGVVEVGTGVNLEFDVIGKYVARMLSVGSRAQEEGA